MIGLVTKHTYMGLQIVESLNATTLEQDWSRCRSPSRSRRRHMRGIRTRLIEVRKPACYQLGNVLYMHPDMLKQVKERTAQSMTNSIESRLVSAFYGQGN